MKKGVERILGEQGYNNLKNRFSISIIILIIATIVFVLIFFFGYPKSCNDSDCFSSYLSNCNRASYIKEDSKATWHYSIKGSYDKDSCEVKVELLRMNQGTIEIEDLQGSEMICIVDKGDTRPPEENMKKCSGVLKEKLQEIIIERMHSYLLKNLGEIKESFAP